MEAIGALLVLFSFGVFLWAVVGLINPVWARLPHRMMSVAVWALSAVLAVAGSSLLPSDDSTEGTESGVGVSAPSNPATESEPTPNFNSGTASDDSTEGTESGVGVSAPSNPAAESELTPNFNSGTAVAQDSFSGRSPTCGPIHGQTQQDLRNVEAFCSAGIPAELGVEGAEGMGSLLWIKIPRPVANVIRAMDSLDSERLILNWMRRWKQLSGSRVVTITVEWQGIEIAVGQTTASFFGGAEDEVTIRR